MSKLKNAIFGLSASGSISGGLTYLRRMRQQIVEKTPVLKDAKTTAQLSWRHMFLKVVALWHALSAAEKEEWESNARPRHMTGYAWFVSQALRPNPGIYLPLQGGTMAGIIDMDGYAIQNMLDPVNPQDADTEAARDTAIAAALAGSLTVDIHGWDGANWQKLLTESAAQHNLRVRLYAEGTPINVQALNLDSIPDASTALSVGSALFLKDATSNIWRNIYVAARLGDADYGYSTMPVAIRGYNGVTYDRLRCYSTGILKVGRAEIGLSDMRRVAVGQVKAAAGHLYWVTMNPSAGNSVMELSDSLAGGAAVKYDHFHTSRQTHHVVLDPPLEFSTGIYLQTITNMTSIIFGYK